MEHTARETIAHPSQHYPPAPWDLAGQMSVGLLRLRAGTMPIPAGARPLLGRRWMILVFVRYLDGVLRYDELAFGTLLMYRRRVGLWVDRIWVDSEESLWGGRRLWGLPKELARFDWRGDMVTVTDAAGPILTLALNPRTAWLPGATFPVASLGQRDGQWIAALGRLRARLAPAGMRIAAWSDRFGYRPAARPLVGLAAKPFRLHLPAGTPLT